VTTSRTTTSRLRREPALAWQTAAAGTEPPGWEWTWELKPQGSDATEVTLTYDWSKVTDKAILEKVTFPLVPRDGLEDFLSRLAASPRPDHATVFDVEDVCHTQALVGGLVAVGLSTHSLGALAGRSGC
jgi:hypothetical protein